MADLLVQLAISGKALVRHMLLEHPWPWTIEADWTCEIIDGQRGLVAKCQTADDAEAIVAVARQLVYETNHHRDDPDYERMLAAEDKDGEAGGSRQLSPLPPPPLPRPICDDRRHLVCHPYSVENLHMVATVLGIKRCWFHAGRLAHYDIPKRRIREVTAACLFVPSRDIVRIIKGEWQP